MSTEEQRKAWREQKAKLRKEKPELINARWRAWRDRKRVENPDYIKARNRANQVRANERRQEYLSDEDTKRMVLERDKAKRKAYKVKYYQTHKEKWHHQYRRSRIKHEFGITPEQYDELKLACDNKCQICLKPETRTTKILGVMQVCALAIDHCHTTGAVRGLLCSRCNSAIGLLNEDVEVIHRAIAYLERN